VEFAVTEDEAAGLTDLIYDAAFDERLWVPVMNRMADVVGGAATAFIRKNLHTGQGRGLFGRITEAQFTDYFGRFARANPLAEAISGIPAGAFLIDWQVMAKDDLVRSEYYNDFLLRREIHGVLGLMVWRQGSEAAIINLTRQPNRGEYLPEHAHLLCGFMPHLRRAVGLAERLPVGSRLDSEMEAVLAASRGGMMVLDRSGRVLYANRAAETVLGAQDGLRTVQGVLATADSTTSQRLAAAIRMAAGPEQSRGSSLAVPRPSGRRPFAVQVTPCRPERIGLFPAPARVLLTVADLDAGIGPGAAALREMFGLSRAQIAVAVLLAEGREPRAIASILGISLFTVRRHLADVMEKTETHTQAQLVRLLVTLSDIDQPFMPGISGPGSRA
jgi:DNA-binding CsgD family transcriptional regulator